MGLPARGPANPPGGRPKVAPTEQPTPPPTETAVAATRESRIGSSVKSYFAALAATLRLDLPPGARYQIRVGVAADR